MGDVNGDGVSDLVVSAPNFNSGVGKVYVYFGGSDFSGSGPDVFVTGRRTSGSDARWRSGTSMATAWAT